MFFELSIGGVDGETNVSVSAPDADTTLRLLHHFDHEGSSVSLSITVDDSEQVYNLLKMLAYKPHD